MIKRMRQIVQKSASDVWARLLTSRELENVIGGGHGDDDDDDGHGHGVGEPKPIVKGGQGGK